MPALQKLCCRARDFRKHIYGNVGRVEFEFWFTRNSSKSMEKQTHPCQFILCRYWLMPKGGSQVTSSSLQFSVGKSLHHYFIMTWHDPAVMYHMLYQSGASPPVTIGGKILTSNALKKKILLNDIWKTQEIIRHTKYYLNLCFKPFTNNQ